MRLIIALAAGALGYFYYCGRNAHARQGAFRQDIARWEGEGGNPAAGARPPADPGESPFPPVDPAVRH